MEGLQRRTEKIPAGKSRADKEGLPFPAKKPLLRLSPSRMAGRREQEQNVFPESRRAGV